MKRKILPIILSLITTISTITPAFANSTENLSNIPVSSIESTNIETIENIDLEIKEDTSIELSEEVENKDSLQTNSTVKTFSEQIKIDLPEEKIEFNPNARIPGAHSPNTAFYLPESVLNQNLVDTIGEQQNWYYFQTTENCKISLTLQMPQNSEYDLVLYKYNNGYLELVSYSQYYGTYEHLSYVDDAGIYFFGIMPYTPANNEQFVFRVDTTTNYDASEPDDNLWFAKQYTNNISQKQTIDNALDEDFFKLDITQSGDTYISLSNITTEKYAVFIYDENLNTIGSFIGDNKLRKVRFPKGSYYIRVQSYDGSFNPNKNYKLDVNTVNSFENVAISNKGDIIIYDTSRISINGKYVPLTWKYEYASPGYPYYRRVQEMNKLFSGVPQKLGTGIRIGTFSGREGAVTNNAVMIPITNVYLFYYFYATGAGTSTQHIDITEDKGYLLAVIDANTGTIIDTSANTLYNDIEEFKRCFRDSK